MNTPVCGSRAVSAAAQVSRGAQYRRRGPSSGYGFFSRRCGGTTGGGLVFEEIIMEATRKIVVGVDATETGARALRNALEIAALGGHTEVHAIRVIEPIADPVLGVLPPTTTDQIAELKEVLQGAIAELIAKN